MLIIIEITAYPDSMRATKKNLNPFFTWSLLLGDVEINSFSMYDTAGFFRFYYLL